MWNNDIIGLLVFFFSILWNVGSENQKKLLALVSSGIVLCANQWNSVDD